MSDTNDLSQKLDWLAEVNLHAATTFLEVVEVAENLLLQAEGKEYQAYFEQFSRSMVESAGQALLAMAKGVGIRTAEEVAGPPVDSEEPSQITGATDHLDLLSENGN